MAKTYLRMVALAFLCLPTASFGQSITVSPEPQIAAPKEMNDGSNSDSGMTAQTMSTTATSYTSVETYGANTDFVIKVPIELKGNGPTSERFDYQQISVYCYLNGPDGDMELEKTVDVGAGNDYSGVVTFEVESGSKSFGGQPVGCSIRGKNPGEPARSLGVTGPAYKTQSNGTVPQY